MKKIKKEKKKNKEQYKIFLAKYSLIFIYLLLFVTLHYLYFIYTSQILINDLSKFLIEFLIYISNKDNLLFFIQNYLLPLLILVGFIAFTIYIFYISIYPLFFKTLYIKQYNKKNKFGRLYFTINEGKFITLYFTKYGFNFIVPYNSFYKLKVKKNKLKENISDVIINLNENEKIIYHKNKEFLIINKTEEQKQDQEEENFYKDINKQLLKEIQIQTSEASLVDTYILKEQLRKNILYIPDDIVNYIKEEEQSYDE